MANMQNNGRDVRRRGLDINFNISLVSNVSVTQCQAPKTSTEAFTDIRFYGISQYQKSNSCYGIFRLKMTEAGLLLQR